MRNVRLVAVPALAAVAVGVAAVPAFAAPATPAATHDLTLMLRPAAGGYLPSPEELATVSRAVEARGLRVTGHLGLTLTVAGTDSTLDSTFRSSSVGVALTGLGSATSAITDAVDPDATPVRWHAHSATPITGLQAQNAYRAPGAPAGSAKVADPVLTSSTPVVATIQLSGWSSSDLTAFAPRVFSDAGYNPVASGQYTSVSVGGASTTTPDGYGGEDEVALDQETILSSAPMLKQRAYFATNGSASSLINAYSQVLSDVASGIPIVALSTSWGSCETGQTAFMNALDPTLSQLEAAGVTVFAASGDDGRDDCENSTTAVDYPASSPNVVGVGGTSHSNGANTPAPDLAWDEPSTNLHGAQNAGGTGGGTSAVYSRPSWQSSLSQSGTKRLVPDMALDADPETGMVVVIDGSTSLAGGTSLAAPMSAAMLSDAVVAHSSVCGVGDIHSVMYAHPADFTDVTASQTTTGSMIQPVTSGYDEATGLGTPNFTALGNDIYNAGAVVCTAPRVTATQPPASTPAPSSDDSAPTVGNPTVQITRWALGSKTGTANLSWVSSDSTASVTGYTVTVLRADGTVAGTDSLDPSIGSLLISAPGGTAYTVTITATDSTGVTATTRSKPLAIPLDDRSSKRSLGWTLLHRSGSLGSTVSSSSKPGATATVTLDGSKLVVLVSTAPTGGSFQLLVDGKVVKTVSTKGKSRNQVAVTVSARDGSHRVMVRVLKAKKGKTGAVALDGFLGS